MRRKLLLLAASICTIAAGATKPAAAQTRPTARPNILCSQPCANSSDCGVTEDACLICFHPEGKCG
jgi:hypothetical protein